MSRTPVSVRLPTPRASNEFGARLLGLLAPLARRASEGIVVTLDGPLGAGKSTLCRALLRAAGVTGAIPSPTFTLLEPYAVRGLSFAHLDLYRLGDPDELAMLGLDEMAGCGLITLVEWGVNAPRLAASACLAVNLDYCGGGRRAELVWR